MTERYQSLFDLVRAALGDKAGDASSLLDLFTEDAVFEFPFAPEATPQRLVGKDAIAAHASRLGSVLTFGDFTLDAVYPSADAVVFEATCQGRGLETNLPYDQKYICVLHLRGGKIARYRDYWNPLVLMSALGGEDQLARTYARLDAQHENRSI